MRELTTLPERWGHRQMSEKWSQSFLCTDDVRCTVTSVCVCMCVIYFRLVVYFYVCIYSLVDASMRRRRRNNRREEEEEEEGEEGEGEEVSDGILTYCQVRSVTLR